MQAPETENHESQLKIDQLIKEDKYQYLDEEKELLLLPIIKAQLEADQSNSGYIRLNLTDDRMNMAGNINVK